MSDFALFFFILKAKILCTNLCKCTGCKNFEESPERKTLMHLADAAGELANQNSECSISMVSNLWSNVGKTHIVKAVARERAWGHGVV